MKSSFLLMLAGVAPWFVIGCASTEDRGRPTAGQWIVVSTNLPAPRVIATNTTQSVPLPPAAADTPDFQKARQEIAQSSATPELIQKVNEGKILSLADIQELARSKVSDDAIIAYLSSTDAVYLLSTTDVERMRQAGVSTKVLDYLLTTRLRPTVLPTYRPSYYYPPPYYYYDPYPAYYYHHHHHYHGPRNYIRRVR